MLIDEKLTGKIILAAIEVYKALGPGLLESVYDKCLSKEFDIIQLIYKNQVELPVVYKGIKVDAGFRIDKIIEDKDIIELKTVEHLLPVHKAQLLTYMKLTGIRVGLLINFNVPVLKDGIKRMVL